MARKALLFLCIALSVPNRTLDAVQARIISTAALIRQQYAIRKMEYITSLKLIQQFRIPCYIVESCATKPTFLDDYSQNVIYTTSNNYGLINKGVNEAMALRRALQHFNFDDEDIIIKLTGRYSFASPYFLIALSQHPEADGFAQYQNETTIFTGCFALKWKYFKRFIETVDLQEMEEKLISFEEKAGQFVHELTENGALIIPMKKLDVHARVFNDGIHTTIHTY